jgi:hypothetical protein
MNRGFYSVLGLALFTCVGVVSIGCDDGKSNGSTPIPWTGPPSGPVQKSDFAKQFAAAVCEGIVDCCRAGGYSANTPKCESVAESAFKEIFAVALTSQNVNYDPALAQHCVSAYYEAALGCTDRDLLHTAATLCNSVFDGAVPLGGVCTVSGECAEDSTYFATCENGVCIKGDTASEMGSGTHAKLGEACGSSCQNFSDGSQTCASSGTPPSTASCWINEGLACSSNFVCVEAPQVGQACASSNSCAAGTYCKNKLCVAQIDSGSCASDLDACSDAFYCDSASKMCTPKKANGVACTASQECTGGDCLNGRCRVWSMVEPSVCG